MKRAETNRTASRFSIRVTGARHLGVATLLLAALPACGDHDPGEEAYATAPAALNTTLPETPALMRNVSMIEGGAYQYPTMPAFRTSVDGRVALNLKGAPTFRVVRPEAMEDRSFAYSDAGTPMVEGSGKELSIDELGSPDIQHMTLCDPTVNSTAPNPQPCGDNNTSDCYDLRVIGFKDNGTHSTKVFSSLVHVRIDNPKTKDAVVVSVVADANQRVIEVWPLKEALEPMVTVDGHLLVARAGGSTIHWQDDQGHPHNGEYDIFYALGDESAAPCDITQWNNRFYPLSHAGYHADAKQRYGFAEYPLRDPEGTPIPDGAEMSGTYPWVDRRGANVFFTTISETLYYHNDQTNSVEARYPTDCVTAGCGMPTKQKHIDTYDEASRTRGIAVAGLWTHGKIVLLDNLLNNVDYGLRVDDSLQRMLQLYQSNSSHTGWVRAGSGRDNGVTLLGPGTNNITFIDSQENLFEHWPQARARAVRDVVWTVNTGRGSDEVVFDDYIDPNAFIFSEMSGSLSFESSTSCPPGDTSCTLNGVLDYHDGFVRTGPETGEGFSSSEPVRVQNAATPHPKRWVVPSYGAVVGGARLEPVALGGIVGKGLWLDGVDDAIEYEVLAQPQNIHSRALFVGVFVDSRFANDGVERRLITFPDGSAVSMIGRSHVRFSDVTGNPVTGFPLPKLLNESGYNHLGFVITQSGSRVRTYLDGFFAHVWNGSPVQLFRMTAGTFRLGADGSGEAFKGWVDELKVLLHKPGHEVICNHARGTLIGLDSTSDATWWATAHQYPNMGHNLITNQLTGSMPPQPTYPKYACFVDYETEPGPHPGDDEPGAHLGNLPDNADSVRAGMVFPEGNLVWDQPRPASDTNAFCLSCHVDGQRHSLTPAILSYDATLTMATDPRRQPMQPPRFISGVVPAGYAVEQGLPGGDTIVSGPSAYVDQWLAPTPAP